MYTCKQEISELTDAHVTTIEKLCDNLTRQAKLNKLTLNKYTQHVGFLQFLLMSEQLSTRQLRY